MTIGISGTRDGMTKLQRMVFALAVYEAKVITPPEWHHGKCVGVDGEAHAIIRQYQPNAKIVLHPPIKPELEADVEGNEIRERKPYLTRNRDIVNETDAMFIIPKEFERQSSGGTWYTYDYALQAGKPVMVIWPDGTISKNGEPHDHSR